MAGTKPSPLRLRFHAVAIAPGKVACEQVRALKGARLLSLEAPRLPLVGCSCATECSCRFQHYNDRRGGPRRADERGVPKSAWTSSDRRRGSRGRRDTDYEETT